MGSIITKAKNLYKIVEENYITKVGGTLTKTAEEINIYTTEEGISMYSNTSIDMKAENETVLGEYQEPPVRESEENVVSIECELYMHNNQQLKIPYLDSLNSTNFKSSKLFIAGLKSIFGDDIGHKTAKKLMQDLKNGNVSYPKWEVVNLPLYSDVGGYFLGGKIYLNQNLILKAEEDPEKCWLLFRIMIEETGHYIDYLLRNNYSNLGGDIKGDEGTVFAADFIRYNQLLSKDFEFAKFKIESSNGEVRDFSATVLMSSPDREQKAKELLFVEDDSDDQGIVTLKNGEHITVEFFKIRGGGAVHEKITKNAAKRAGFTYDYRLDEGCAWPDVPCGDENSVETCYFNTWWNLEKEGTLAYRSHRGDLQYWHSMAPTGKNTNEQVVDKIITQAQKWFKKAVDTPADKDGDDGLFHIGKILHMVQDSYSLSHVQRDAENRIIQIQSYNDQDEHKHGEPDKDGKSKQARDAEDASVLILNFYKQAMQKNMEEKVYLQKLKEILSSKIYLLAPNRSSVMAGGSLDEYKKTK